MAYSKRYTIFSLYIRGSNQSPQACHGLNNLWKSYVGGQMSTAAAKLFLDWSNTSEVEIMLQGGYHADLEELYKALQGITDTPSAKFNESIEANNGACSLVTFVASERIVSLNNYIRDNRLTPANAAEKIKNAEIPFTNADKGTFKPTADEVFVASKVAFLKTAS